MALIERLIKLPSDDIQVRVNGEGAILRVFQPACRADAVDICLSIPQLELLLTEAREARTREMAARVIDGELVKWENKG